MQYSKRTLHGWLITAGVLMALTLAPSAGQTAPRTAITPIQRLGPAPRNVTTLPSEHFDLQYDPSRLTEEQAKEARSLSESAWTRNRELFGTVPDHRLKIDLTPDFQGATGFFKPGDPMAKDANRRPFIGVRFGELDYLGLPAEYVLRHEIAHWFSGPLAGSPLGEGIADWAAGEFAELPARPWWGETLRKAGLWMEPDAFFLTGEFDAPAEVDAPLRTAQYAESALLIRYLVERFGWEKFRAFATDYGEARGPLSGNASRKELRYRPRRPQAGKPEERDPRLPPDANALRALFEKHFGTSWTQLRGDWEKAMRADPAPPEQAEGLVLAFRIYGSIRNYEMWLIQQRNGPSRATQQAVRRAFTQANASRRQGNYPEARQALADARSLVQQLREPQSIARSSPEDLGNLTPQPGV